LRAVPPVTQPPQINPTIMVTMAAPTHAQMRVDLIGWWSSHRWMKFLLLLA
jgi:hypothetical protein